MKKPFPKIKIIILLLGLFLVAAGIYLLSQKKKAPLPVSAPGPQQATWNGLVPGISSKEEAIQKLGKPEAEVGTLLEFDSSSPTRNHLVSLDGNTVSLIKEVVSSKDAVKISDLTSKYGAAPDVLYGPDAENGYYLFVYAQSGIAYLGNPASENLLEVWYFPATTFEDFIVRWGSAYSKNLTPKF